ncbi:hypothetical protein V8E52_002052 [Russula decolorans]
MTNISPSRLTRLLIILLTAPTSDSTGRAHIADSDMPWFADWPINSTRSQGDFLNKPYTENIHVHIEGNNQALQYRVNPIHQNRPTNASFKRLSSCLRFTLYNENTLRQL